MDLSRPHSWYDYVFLVIPLCYALSLKSLRLRAPIVLGVFIFWFLAAFLNRAANDQAVHLAALAVNVLLLAGLLTYTTVVALRMEPAFRPAPDPPS